MFLFKIVTSFFSRNKYYIKVTNWEGTHVHILITFSQILSLLVKDTEVDLAEISGDVIVKVGRK